MQAATLSLGMPFDDESEDCRAPSVRHAMERVPVSQLAVVSRVQRVQRSPLNIEFRKCYRDDKSTGSIDFHLPPDAECLSEDSLNVSELACTSIIVVFAQPG